VYKTLNKEFKMHLNNNKNTRKICFIRMLLPIKIKTAADSHGPDNQCLVPMHGIQGGKSSMSCIYNPTAFGLANPWGNGLRITPLITNGHGKYACNPTLCFILMMASG